MKTFLGIDGGGTKTDFLLIDERGHVLATHRAGCAYHLEIGLAALQTLIAEGIQATLKQGGLSASKLSFAFIGLPAYGEDSTLLSRFDSIASDVLSPKKFRCGNDMVCGWAGALAGNDGINIIAGTGSIAYGEFETRRARAGGWGELFSDEGSAYWIAREILAVFSRMSDGRLPKGPLYEIIRERLQLRADLDVCGVVYGPPPWSRAKLASLAPLGARAACAGDPEAKQLFQQAARHLAEIVHAVRDQLDVPHATPLPVSYSGGMFRFEDLLKPVLEASLRSGDRTYQFVEPRLAPVAGAALYAAKLAETVITDDGVAELVRVLGGSSDKDLE